MPSYGSSINRSLYFALPYAVKNLTASIYGIQQRISRYGKEYRKSLEFLKKAQYWTNSRLLDYQKEQTARFIQQAFESTPYYRNRPSYGKDVALERLPLLEKNEVQCNLDQFYPVHLHRIPYRWAHTSGTTGKSLVFPLSISCFQREYAFRALHYSWGNISLSGREKVAFCAGHPVAHYDKNTPPFWVYDWTNNWLFLSSYHLSEKNLLHYIKELERFEPLMLGGYPSSIYLLALAYRKYGTGKLKLRSIYCSSETLLDFQRRAIEDSFQTKVFNWYGTSEMCVNIVECEKGEMHLKLEHSYIEILNNHNKPCTPGETGRIICTGFGNEAFPLVRYEIGDTVTISADQTSKCGRGGILIDKVLGRVEDYVITADGRLAGRLDHIFKDSKNVVEAQIAQKKIGEVILRIVKNEVYSTADEQAITQEAQLRLGSDTRLLFEYVDSIPRTKNGKFRFVESKINSTNMFNN